MSEGSRWQRIREAWRHAFAVGGPMDNLEEEDRQLLQALAARVQARRLEEVAILFLESVRPMGFLGGQAVHFLHGTVGVIMDAPRLEKLALVLEKREAIPYLIELLEEGSSSGDPKEQPE